MKPRIAILAVAALSILGLSRPANLHGQDVSPNPQHEHHPGDSTQPAPAAADQHANMMGMMNMMSRMKAADPMLDELVKKMNAATGPAKVDAMAELLTALVEDRRNASEPMMSGMTSMMQMMSTMKMDGHGGGSMPMTPHK